MKLWIRSQDREMLRINPELEIYEDNNKNILVVDTKGSTDYYIAKILGKYKSKERALEVLDEIQGKITQNECLKTMIPKLNNIKGEEEKIGKLFKEMVYEMPKE